MTWVQQKTAPPVFSRRTTIQKLGGISFGAATGRRQWGGEEAQRAYYRTKPRWASWTVPQLNVQDGWSEPTAWMARIENSHHVPYIHDNFNRLLRSWSLTWVSALGVKRVWRRAKVSTMGTHPQVFYIDLDGVLSEDGANTFNTIYPYAVGTNTKEYDDLTGQVLLQTPTGGERGTP